MSHVCWFCFPCELFNADIIHERILYEFHVRAYGNMCVCVFIFKGKVVGSYLVSCIKS